MRGFRHWRWHLDEMYVKLNGEMVYLWRAVDHEGEVLESYVTRPGTRTRSPVHEEGAEAPWQA
jgi:transposase-like protein